MYTFALSMYELTVHCNIAFCVNRTRSLNNICFYVHGWHIRNGIDEIASDFSVHFYVCCFFFCVRFSPAAFDAISLIVLRCLRKWFTNTECWYFKRKFTLFIRFFFLFGDPMMVMRYITIYSCQFLSILFFVFFSIHFLICGIFLCGKKRNQIHLVSVRFGSSSDLLCSIFIQLQ